ncbi:MAG: preprotein translocase subunit SecG [Gammaproteobacteria bacterium]|nr:preprotein translocase subunit SecG [Gammaproteobacteria bacterium]
MTTLHTLILIGHVVIAAMLIGAVLLQRGKGADAGAGFGSGASGTVFGARGSANFLTRTTGVLATLFFVTSLSLAFIGAQRPVAKSLLETTEAPAEVELEFSPAPADAAAEQGEVLDIPAPAE